jgi:putative copper export protein
MTVTRTAMGHNCLAAMAIMAAIGFLARGAARRWSDLALGALLVAFACCRAMNTHAAEEGVFSLGFLMECLHLVLTSLWLGLVVMAAWIVVPRYRDAGVRHRDERELYLARLSASATAALIGILLTGMYNAAMRLGSWDNIGGNTYSTVLLVKGALVLVALAIGGYNRLAGFPGITARDQVTPAVLLLLRLESLVLVGALLAAISLASMSPPSSL